VVLRIVVVCVPFVNVTFKSVLSFVDVNNVILICVKHVVVHGGELFFNLCFDYPKIYFILLILNLFVDSLFSFL
jgi:hypothetical protein